MSVIDDNDIYRIVDNSPDTVFRTVVNNAVMRRFRSEHLLASQLIADSVIATLAFTDKIEPNSVDKFVTCISRRTKSMYGTINSAFIPVAERFEEYAKTILPNYDYVKSLDLRTTNFIVYVIATELSENKYINRMELFYKTYKFDELRKKLPQFD